MDINYVVRNVPVVNLWLQTPYYSADTFLLSAESELAAKAFIITERQNRLLMA